LACALALGTASARADVKADCVDASDQGQTSRDQGKLIDARARFAACVSDACPHVVRVDCAKWLADVDDRMPTILVRAKDRRGLDILDLRVTVDGAPIAVDGRFVPIDPGVHTFRFEHEGSVPMEQRLLVREREKNRVLDVTLEDVRRLPDMPVYADPPPARPFPVAAAIAAGVSLVGVAGFAYFGATAKSDLDHLRNTCEPSCAQSDVDSARTKWIVANVSIGVAVVAAGVAVWLFLTRPEAPRPPIVGSSSF
jgi:hypothetical protein